MFILDGKKVRSRKLFLEQLINISNWVYILIYVLKSTMKARKKAEQDISTISQYNMRVASKV